MAGPATDALYGGAGDDLLYGGANADLIDGGTGIDTVVFSEPVAARVDLLLTTEQKTGQGPDRIVNVENLTGGALSDWLRGNALDNVLKGGAGNDSLMGHLGNDTLVGGAGNDYLAGGAGNDTALFLGSTSVRVDLQVLSAQNTGLGMDRLTGIENLAASEGNDTLLGDAAGNVLSGGAGNDMLQGRQGNDTILGGDGADSLHGGAGNDLLTGGGGADRFVFVPFSGADRITDFDLALDEIRFLSGVASMSDLALADAGDDLVITYQNGAITLAGLATETLTTDHFLFG